MLSALRRLLRGLLGEAGARMMIGSGVAFASYGALTVAITAMLSEIVAGFGGLPSGVAGVVLTAGCGEAISIVGAAMLTRVALQSAALGLTRTSA